MYELACQRALGLIVAHSLEATCRTIEPGESEREIVGQISHRLFHRGAQPLVVSAAADGPLATSIASSARRRCRCARRWWSRPRRKFGLSVTASRTMSFGTPDETFQQDHNAVCRVSASYLASTWPDAVPREILLAGRRIYLISGYEHEWLLAPQGHVTGRSVVEETLTPSTEELFESNWAITWTANAGAAVSCDTFHVTDQGPVTVTPTEIWPLKRIRIQGAEFVRPDILIR